MSADDDYMGTPEDAQAQCLDAWKAWCGYRQPFIGTAAEHRKREALERQAEVRFINASALLCWHLESAALAKASPPTEGGGK